MARDDEDEEIGSSGARNGFGNMVNTKLQPKTNEVWPGKNGNGGDFTGEGLIVTGEAGAQSHQGQSVKIIPDTCTMTDGTSTCWGSSTTEEDGHLGTWSEKKFVINGEITVTEDSTGEHWGSSSSTSDGSASKWGQQGTVVKDSEYMGELNGGLACSCSCDQDPIDKSGW